METRKLILDKALKLFSEKGIKETTIRDIAKSVGITEGAIYRHFSSKEEIVYELFSKYSEELYNKLMSVITKEKDPEVKFKKCVDTFLKFSFRNPDAFRYMNIFHYIRGKEVKKFSKVPMVIFYELLEELDSAGLLHLKPEYAMAVVVGSLERIFLYKNMGIIKDSKTEVRKYIADLLWNVITNCFKS